MSNYVHNWAHRVFHTSKTTFIQITLSGDGPALTPTSDDCQTDTEGTPNSNRCQECSNVVATLKLAKMM
jgi:hypothetical protein